MLRAGVVVSFVVLAAAPAFAGGTWTKDVSFEAASKTALKVVEPDGFKVQVPVNGDVQEDTVPAAFNFGDQSSFVTVTVVAPDGEKWKTKVELKEKQVTILKVKYKAPDEEKPSKEVVKYIGQAQNMSHLCENQDNTGDIRVEFMLKGKSKLVVDVPLNTYYPNIELEAAEWDVRVYVKQGSADFRYLFTGKWPVSADGWVWEYGCRAQ